MTSTDDEVPDTIPEGEEEQDEEVRLAMEMALAAAKNPGLTPAQLQELLGKKNKQADIVDQVKKEKEEKAKEQAEKAKEEASKKWTEQKERAYSWFSGATAAISESTSAIRAAAERVQSSAEQQIYAEQIKKDPEHIELRKKIKAARKTFKAKRLAGNRIETRHRFKRHRMESTMLSQEERIEKGRKLFLDSNYNLQEYGKAVIRAGRKYKSSGSKEEENLEALLCRNMHQMLSIDKQKAKMKKSNKEIKKYMQRCKSWISDKQAFWEMNLTTLDATNNAMKALYEDTLAHQDKLIQKLQACEDLKDVNLADVEVPYLDALPKNAGPRRMLCALRGLPFSDSIRVHAKSSGASVKRGNGEEGGGGGGRPELYIQTNGSDDVSVSSHLSDPDDFESIISQESGFGFGDDAPFNMGDNSPNNSKKVEIEMDHPSMKAGLKQPPSTTSKPAPDATSNVKSAPAPAPTTKSDSAPNAGKSDSSSENENDEAPQSPEEDAPKAEAEANNVSEDKTTETVETTPCSTVSVEA